MRFVVDNIGEIFVRDTLTNTHRQAESIFAAHREAARLNDYYITHDNYERVNGFIPVNFPMTDQFMFFRAEVLGQYA